MEDRKINNKKIIEKLVRAIETMDELKVTVEIAAKAESEHSQRLQVLRDDLENIYKQLIKDLEDLDIQEDKTNNKESLFIDLKHNGRYIEIKNIVQIDPEDLCRKSALFLLTGKEELYNKISTIYNYEHRRFNSLCIEDKELSAEAIMILKLAIHLDDSKNECPSLTEMFLQLKNQDEILALNAIKIRFNVLHNSETL